MNSGSAHSSDDRLAEAVSRYIEATENGREISQESLLREFADVADELSDMFASIDFIHRATSNLPSSDPNAGLQHRTLGDYRILREIGRGGMGIVFEAEQVSLQRQVALKILPFAAALDSTQLARFRHEALAAAQLHHEHIVPVYSVGHESGTHYYVMRYIDGVSMSQLVSANQEHELKDAEGRLLTNSNRLGTNATSSESRKAYFKRIAELLLPVVDALEQAHRSGTVHRDVKPSNLLLDGDGKMWLTDFGLAMSTGVSDLTPIGDIVGTFRYMSPEQVAGNRATVDHRSDVYSLGATLYELLTRQPAFGYEDKARLLHAVVHEDPLPPRRIDSQIPTDLETIALKSMHKEPAKRYQSAAELREDLRRFLDERPIAAKRPSALEHLQKWSRRHRTLVRSGLVFGFLTLIGLATTSILLAQERARTQAALTRSLLQLEQAREAIGAVYNVVTQREYRSEPTYRPLLNEVTEVSLNQLQQLAETAPQSTRIRLSICVASMRMGAIARHRGDEEAATQWFQRFLEQATEAVSELRVRLQDHPHSVEVMEDYVYAAYTKGNAQLMCGQTAAEARDELAEALDAAQSFCQRSRASGKLRYRMARGYCYRMTNLGEGLLPEARLSFGRKALEQIRLARETDFDLDLIDSQEAHIHETMSVLSLQMDELDAAMESANSAVDVRQRMIDRRFVPSTVRGFVYAMRVKLRATQRAGDSQRALAVAQQLAAFCRRAEQRLPTIDRRLDLIRALESVLELRRKTGQLRNPAAIIEEARQAATIEVLEERLRRLMAASDRATASLP